MDKRITEFLSKVDRALCTFFPEGALEGKKILVALSGGADSVSLLHSLCHLSEKHGYSVCACHINHMIRGDEADRDEEFSRSLCKSLGVEFYCERIDVPALSKKRKEGLEQTAREVRYSVFEELCRTGRADYVATAHNACDKAEGILLNITRGCGGAGLCGMPRVRENIIRPLLDIERREIEAYLECIGSNYVTDSTNLSNEYSRNIVRNEIIPHFQKINPAFIDSVLNMSRIIEEQESFLARLAIECYTDSVSALARLDKVILCRILSGMYKEVCGSGLDKVHLDGLCDYIKEYSASGGGEKKSFCLPGNIVALIENGKISVMQKKENLCEYLVIATKGINVLPGGKIIAEIKEDATKDITKEYGGKVYGHTVTIPLYSKLIKEKIILRSRKEGEKIRLSGHSRSIKKLSSENKLPGWHRQYFPRICDGEDKILAFYGVGICDEQRESASLADTYINIYSLCNKE